jgi:hypothetical protein
MAIESLFLILEKKEEEAAAQIEKMCYHNWRGSKNWGRLMNVEITAWWWWWWCGLRVRQCFCGVMYTKWDNRLKFEAKVIQYIRSRSAWEQQRERRRANVCAFLISNLCVWCFFLYERITMARINNKKKVDIATSYNGTHTQSGM